MGLDETHSLKLALWNANGLSHHLEELKIFLNNHSIDVMLVSETHFTTKVILKFLIILFTLHPDDKAHGSTAILIRNKIKHHMATLHCEEQIQSTSVVVEDWLGPITLAAVYCSPKYAIKEDLIDFCITKGIFDTYIKSESYLSSNHTPGKNNNRNFD